MRYISRGIKLVNNAHRVAIKISIAIRDIVGVGGIYNSKSNFAVHDQVVEYLALYLLFIIDGTTMARLAALAEPAINIGIIVGMHIGLNSRCTCIGFFRSIGCSSNKKIVGNITNRTA